ncbi:hypothetical protein DYB30_006138 [Aphanomyces astaci]|uniref:BTB domain-containing protein n=1 Tax=Aphanomyces astaci TaxID=112090 RepID=A0A397CX11_APHAT|nr:hypothetical protein DYB36_007268 [Aphanomyces astaci]RHY40450.1 hypothetical protein DYB34_001014 [Aphanomyces astaci]RHY54661.1 hypothetical protein DYB38_003423 [Aphanomyces astaci]RHY55251.1 hypothetical protein DYB30_006138 [Aphanomyces astaci]
MRNPELVTADEMIEPTAAVIVTFDVGGTIFRCKQRVVEKYPNKRLHRLLLCGCEQQSSASIISTSTQTTAASLATCAPTTTAIFVDRNPTYFAPILDWYRCGTFHVPDSLSVAGLQHEAAYFDVLADMFPTLDTANTTLPPAPIQSSLASATATPLSPHSTLQSAQTPTIIPTLATAIHCFVKSYTHTLVPSQPPIVFVLRAHEQLVLDSAAGVGRLLLRVTDLHGNTTVSRAVLYDSHSYFFLGGGLAKLHGTPFPGNLIYSFWADDTCTTTTTTSTLASSGGGVEMLPPLHVEFKLRCAFHKSDELVLAAHEQQLLGHTLDMVAKTTSATITTAVLAGLDLSLHVTASAWLQHYQREVQQSTAILREPPSNSDSNSPNKKGSTGAAATNVTPRQVGKRK